ncbi:unnamed protein product [Prorocentrum cordatum]|uniref:Peptidase M20 dimerisation domain-containing protein n=1 Tax=Prorocentrum cordatum TaxID=2364126 RepID=A0ABN9SIT8_9DINO|nr:unnamed protein product [Polarella glacialis]
MWKEQFAHAGPGDAAAEPQGRSVKYRQIECTEDKQKIDLALKLGVIANQKARLLAAACTVEIEMLVEGPIMRAMAKAHAEEYLPRVKGKAGHGLGAPDSFLLTAAIITMLESCEEGFKAPLKEYLDKFKPGSKEAQHIVGLFRTEKMYDSKKKRLIIGMKDEKFEKILVSAIESVEKRAAFSGPRPPGHLELEGQKLVIDRDHEWSKDLEWIIGAVPVIDDCHEWFRDREWIIGETPVDDDCHMWFRDLEWIIGAPPSSNDDRAWIGFVGEGTSIESLVT